MVRNNWILLAWLSLTLFILITNLSILATIKHTAGRPGRLNAAAPADTNFQLTAAGNTSQVLSTTITAGDARVLLLSQFMARHGSPIAPYADIIVAEADRFGLDFRLLPAIAMCESNLGKHIPSKDSYNAWGVAVFTGQASGKKFDNWISAIQWVSKYVKEQYYDRGYSDLRDIGAIWAPPSVENGYSWTNCVEGFQNSII
jgi:hypothetical protein